MTASILYRLAVFIHSFPCTEQMQIDVLVDNVQLHMLIHFG